MILSSLFKYYQADTLIHRLDVRVKIIFLIVLSSACVIFGSPGILFGLWMVSLAVLFAARTPWSKSKYLFYGFIFLAVTVGLTQGLFYYGPRHHLIFQIGDFKFYQEGLIYGL